MFGQPNQQQTSTNLFGIAPQLGQSTGGFTFGAAAGSSSTSSTPAVGGFNFSAQTQQSGKIYCHEQRSLKNTCQIATKSNEIKLS